jgi:hypothetical protein
MKRHSRAGSEAIKGRRPKMPKPTRRNAPNVQTRPEVSPATEETEVVRLTRELSEERKQRAATAEVLHLLSGSHGDLNSLFDTILSNATKLCQANFGTLHPTSVAIEQRQHAWRVFADTPDNLVVQTTLVEIAAGS